MPDVVWHPVNETPPHCGNFLVCMDRAEELEFAVARPRFCSWSVRWESGPWGDDEQVFEIDDITHWAEFEGPEPAEEE